MAKFVAQNPIIGSLLTQIESSKTKPKCIKRALDKAAPDIKDILLKQKKLDKLDQPNLIDFDADDNDTLPFLPLQSQLGFIPSSPPLPPVHPDLSSPPDLDPTDPTVPDDISQIFDEFDNLSAEIENVLGKKDDIKLSKNLQDLFPEAYQIFKKIGYKIKNEVSLPNIEQVIQELNKGKTPVQLDFFVGQRNAKFQSKATQLGLSENNIEFLKYLQFDICATLLGRNKIEIHIEMGQFFFANVNSAESIYKFLLV